MMILNLEISTSSLFLYFLPALFLLILIQFKPLLYSSSSDKNNPKFPRSYPFIGHIFSIYANKERGIQWTSELALASPSKTIVIHRPVFQQIVITANPANIRHILRTHFHNYEKGDFFSVVIADLLGEGIFNTDGEKWKFQRQVASYEFNTKSLRKFIEQVVDSELSDRLIPVLSAAAANNTVLDLQDILQRFTFDNVCKIAFGYDPAYLSPSLPNEKFAQAFEDAVRIISQRFQTFHPLIWKIKRYFNVGSEKDLRIAVNQVRDFAKNMVKEKKEELKQNASLKSVDLLSRFLTSGHSEENFVTDIVISFILAGRDTTSAALVWFFWLISKYENAEHQILTEITNYKSESYDEVKEMVYTHAAISESMRLYPPVPVDGKQVVNDDILPDGTVVKRGTRVNYHPFAMGRSEEIWGNDWPEFRPERWLKEDPVTGGRQFVAKDAYEYPVFQAGPRICLGKDMAVLQMKSISAGVLRQFKVIPVMENNNKDPIFISYLTSKMKGGFPVRIEQRKL